MKNFFSIAFMSVALILLYAERIGPALACFGIAYFLSLNINNGED
jgi:hypothetical protein